MQLHMASVHEIQFADIVFLKICTSLSCWGIFVHIDTQRLLIKFNLESGVELATS